MSAWRRIAIGMFPEKRRLIEDAREVFSVYTLLFELLSMAQDAHARKDRELLSRIYRYAEWCWQQQRRSPDIQNAVAVAFYEHLVDQPITRQALPEWLPPDIFEELLGLFRPRLAKDDYNRLIADYDGARGTKFASKHRTR